MSQSAVFEMQTYLRNIGRLDEDISYVVPDGIFGKETTLAVKSFQKKYDLKETGIVDFETWESLKKENAKALFCFSQPIQIVKITNADLPLKLDDSDTLIYTLHLMLNKIAATFNNFTVLAVEPHFNIGTQKAVRLWQKIIGHEESGIVDKLTWDTLSLMYLLPIQDF